MKSIPILLVTQSEDIKKTVTLCLVDHYGEYLQLRRLNLVEDSLSEAASNQFHPELVIIEQTPLKPSLLKIFFETYPNAAVILVSSTVPKGDELKTVETSARFVLSIEIGGTLPVLLKKYEASGKIKTYSDTEYVSVDAARVLKMKTLPVDVYLKSPSGAFVIVFKKSDQIVDADVNKYAGQCFYLVKKDCEQLFKDQVKKLEDAANDQPIDQVKAKKISEVSQELVRNLVSQVGFTEEAQQIAKSSVALSIKMMGTKPKLAKILQDLKKKDGNFVTSHSFLLGQVSCAMAYTVGWNSAPTFFKLSMAAFLHDIALNMNTSETETTLDEAEKSENYTLEELKILKFHPAKAGEYTRQFSEIPADVEQLVAQHHERADGTGYPRGLSAKYISPLSALFIIAHDMIIFMINHPEAKIEKFYELHEKNYQQAPFKKTFTALKTECSKASLS